MIEAANLLVASLHMSKDSGPVGGGVGIGQNLVATCAHVVDDALGRKRGSERPAEDVRVEVHITWRQLWSRGKVVYWKGYVENGAGSDDLAVLELDDNVFDVPPAFETSPSKGNVDIWGFHRGGINGSPIEANFVSMTADKRCHCRGKNSGDAAFFEDGASGSGIFLGGTSQLIGIVTGTYQFDDAREGLGIGVWHIASALDSLGANYVLRNSRGQLRNYLIIFTATLALASATLVVSVANLPNGSTKKQDFFLDYSEDFFEAFEGKQNFEDSLNILSQYDKENRLKQALDFYISDRKERLPDLLHEFEGQIVEDTEKQRISVAERDIGMAAIQFVRGFLFHRSDTSGAERLFCEAADTAKNIPEYWIECGKKRLRTSALDKAKAAFEKAEDYANPNTSSKAKALRYIGDILATMADHAGARRMYDQSISILNLLEPTDEVKRDLSILDMKIGDLLAERNEDNLALGRYNRGLLRIKSNAVSKDMERWRSILLNRIGDVQLKSKDPEAAWQSYSEDLNIATGLTESVGDNGSQRDLAVSYLKLGDVRREVGDRAKEKEDKAKNFTEAESYYQKSSEILKRLENDDPENSAWKRELAISHDRLGDVWWRLGDKTKSEENYGKSHELRIVLQYDDPSNTEWRRDVAISHYKLGVHNARIKEFEVAIDKLDEGLKIVRGLVELDPSNSTWKQDLIKYVESIATVMNADGNIVGAQRCNQEARDLRESGTSKASQCVPGK